MRVMVVVVVVLVLATVGAEPAVEDCGYEGAAGKELFGMWAWQATKGKMRKRPLFMLLRLIVPFVSV